MTDLPMGAAAEKLLLKLWKQGGSRSAIRAWENGAPDWEQQLASGKLLIEMSYARSIQNSEALGVLHLRLTPAGIDRALRLKQESSVARRITRFNWLGWLTFVAAAASAYFAYTGPHR